MSSPDASHPVLILIRHGQTAWTISGQHTGRTDIPLTANGEAEARALGPHLANIVFSHVIVSPRQRARQTCELSGLGHNDKIIATDLEEWDYGDYEGRSSSEIRAARPGWNIFRDGCPHGETPEQIAERADRLSEYLMTLGGTIALFTHGEFGTAFAVRWIGLPVLAAQHFAIATASIGVLTVNPAVPDLRVISSWNTVTSR